MAFDRSWIDKYAAGAEHVSLAIRGLTRDDLLAAPPDDAAAGKWTIQQVVIHLADAEQVLADRIKRLIAEDKPTLLAFDENAWASKLFYNDQPADIAAELIAMTRKLLTPVLQHLEDDAFARSGMHSERGPLTLAELIMGTTHHLEHHLKFIHAKRAAMGKEMW